MNYTGDEHFTFEGMPTTALVSDFLSWVSSDLTSTFTRQLLAEFIVSSAIGLDASEHKNCAPFAIKYNDKVVEVKASGYISSQNKEGLVAPLFGIAPIYNYDTNELATRSRKADVYVFCLLNCLNRNELDPTKLEQWQFFVFPTTILNEKCGDKRSLSVDELKSLEPAITDYEGLQSAIDTIV